LEAPLAKGLLQDAFLFRLQLDCHFGNLPNPPTSSIVKN
jgi:hypothetical protein